MTPTRAPRSDAQRNRRRVLDTAGEMFAREGRNAGLLDIAAAAGVGAGTVYRHFPTKEALYAAVVSSRLTALLDRVADLPDDPSGDRLFAFWRLAVDQARENADLCELVTETTGRPLEIDEDVRLRYRRTVDDLVTMAKSNERLRADLGTDDVLALLAAAATAETRPHEATSGSLADLIAASMRADGDV